MMDKLKNKITRVGLKYNNICKVFHSVVNISDYVGTPSLIYATVNAAASIPWHFIIHP